jgi:hypothetical protein
MLQKIIIVCSSYEHVMQVKSGSNHFSKANDGRISPHLRTVFIPWQQAKYTNLSKTSDTIFFTVSKVQCQIVKGFPVVDYKCYPWLTEDKSR